MPFPDVKRVQYSKNPLEEVVCQLRFPALLRIDTEPPAKFQESIKEIYPEYAEATDLNFQLPPGVPNQIPVEIFRQAVQSSTTKNHRFSTEDKNWWVNLTRIFVALTTTKYQRWEVFKERVEVLYNALLDIYTPPNLTRIGLRYVNVIRRSVLGLIDIPWSELLAEHIIGMFSSEDVASRIKSTESTSEIVLSDDRSIVRIITKLVKATDDNETCFMIDSDFYNPVSTPTDQVLENLDFLNSRASRLIRWAITDKLHEAMEPSLL